MCSQVKLESICGCKKSSSLRILAKLAPKLFIKILVLKSMLDQLVANPDPADW